MTPRLEVDDELVRDIREALHPISESTHLVDFADALMIAVEGILRDEIALASNEVDRELAKTERFAELTGLGAKLLLYSPPAVGEA